jgi:hypothetical protein
LALRFNDLGCTGLIKSKLKLDFLIVKPNLSIKRNNSFIDVSLLLNELFISGR